MSLKLDPSCSGAYYNRSLGYETLGKFSAAVRDLEAYLTKDPDGQAAAQARERLEKLRVRIDHEAEPPWSVQQEMWTDIVSITLEQTVAELIESVQAKAAFFVVIELSENRHAVAPIYGENGIRHRLTEIADCIGESILTLRLGQFHDLWPECVRVEPTVDRELALQLTYKNGGHALVCESQSYLGVLSLGWKYHYPHLPTAIFGLQPIFERREKSEDSHHCPTCGTSLAYFQPVIRHTMLDDYVCGHCGASPIPRWIEQRMRPGSWSRSGFLDGMDILEDVITTDNQTLQRLNISHEQIASALDQILDAASNAYADHIAEAIARFQENMRITGQKGVEGEAILPLQPSLDDVEKRLQNQVLVPSNEGISIHGLQVFLQVYLGYQYCPWTVLHRPWSNDVPPLLVSVHQVDNFLHQTAVIGCSLPCRRELMYRYGDRDFLVINQNSGLWIRGSGLMVHLIRDHHFFESNKSRYRLDPELAARVLGLCEPGT